MALLQRDNSSHSRVDDYLKRSGDEDLVQYGTLESNEHGFCIWQLFPNTLFLHQVYGDGKYWDQWANDKATELGVKKIMFMTRRNPKVFMRKYKCTLAGYVLEREHG